MDEILKQCDCLLKYGCDEENRQKLYQLLGEYNSGSGDIYYLYQYVLPKIYELYNQRRISKLYIYLSLITYQNLELLKNFVKYEKTIFRLNIEDPVSLFEYTIYKGQHWFEYIIRNPEEYEKIFDFNIYNKLVFLKFLNVTNSSKLCYERIVSLVKKIDGNNLEEFYNDYIEDIKEFICITEMCSENLIDYTPHEEIFSYATNHTALETITFFTDLRNVPNTDILELIYKEPEVSRQQDINIFTSFYVLANLLDCIVLGPEKVNIPSTILDIKEKLLGISERTLLVQVLRCIFSLIFLKESHLKNLQSEKDFCCQNKDIRMIIYLLKDTVEDILANKDYEKHSQQFQDISQLKVAVTDAIWRMDIITNVKEEKKCNKNLLAYMLSSPESLIQMCLKCHDLERAYQVIKICDVKNETLSSQIEFSEKLHDLRESLKQKFRVKAIQLENPELSISTIETSLELIVKRFFKDSNPSTCVEIEPLLKDGSINKRFFSHFKNDIFLNMLDLAVTQVTHLDDCRLLLHSTISEHPLDPNISSALSKFCRKITDICNSTGNSMNMCACEILVSRYFVDPNVYAIKEDFYKNIAELFDEIVQNLKLNETGSMNNSHPSHKTFQKLNNLCKDFIQMSNAEHVPYLSKFFNYLKAFCRILYIEQNNSDIVSKNKNSSYFDLIGFNRSELVGKLVFERKMTPGEFEKYFGVLKLDYLYHIIGNCFPTINLHTQENITKDELYPENHLYVPDKNIITYIQKRNWLLAFLLNEIYKVQDVKIDVNQARLKVFSNYLSLKRHEHLRDLYEKNLIVTALQNDISYQKVSTYINTHILKEENLMMQQSVNSTDSFETGEEIVEGILQTINWKALDDIIKSIPENQLKKYQGFRDLRDKILIKIVHDAFEIDYYRYVRFISDTDQRITTMLENMRKWPASFCIKVIKSEISRRNSVEHPKIGELKLWLKNIELNEKIMKILELKSWSKAYDMSQTDPQLVLQKLIETKEVNDMLNFINLHRPSNHLLEKINEAYIVSIFENSGSSEPVRNLLDILPHDHSMDLCYNLLKILRDLNHLQFIIAYMLQHVDNDSLKKASISLKILAGFTLNEQEQLLCLIYNPLNIIEVLIMNTKLDRLASVLRLLKSISPKTDLLDKIDEMIRTYAEKSLDFRVITQPNPRLLRTPECKLMQSLDSLLDNRAFIMPVDVPTKDEWTDNNEIIICMCCQKTTFSMFNRRHHCRRCGRVVCYYCSLHRMLVPTYGDILVRVCEDCYQQTLGDGSISEKHDTISTKSNPHDFWLLTDDIEHNQIVRDEFSYDHAPSVSLCLSLMKYHSRNSEYPKFLLDQCDVMLKLLIPTQEPIQEIDYFLVIKMLKSLTVAAKVSSTDCNFPQGASLADCIISQAELLGLLAERGCLNMLPIPSSHGQASYVDASVLRKLRDRLLEREQWNLALEVSTKAGLDNAGIFAAWGKSCLRAGSLILAREKFQRCMEKATYCDNVLESCIMLDSSESLNKSRTIAKSSKNLLTEAKPLLDEIITILESNSQAVGNESFKEIESQKLSASITTLNQSSHYSVQDTACCVLNKLKHLKDIADGNYRPSVDVNIEVNSSKPPVNKTFFDECIYYLKRYGSPFKLIDFYIKHGHFEDALKYILDSEVSNDIFVEIYMRCLKDGIVPMLQENMSKIDTSLEVWKDYIRHLCRHLEKQNMLHSLYQLQQYMGDYIRAAMTCIRFYQENVNNFTDLANNISFLAKAEDHLRHGMEQEQWIELAPVRKSSVSSEECYEEKCIVNPSIVMKMNTRDIYKHIHTMHLQNEVSKFLSDCESLETKPLAILTSMEVTGDSEKENKLSKSTIPTLFGTMLDKVHLAVLTIVCGINVSDGFDISQRLIQEFKLKPIKIYCEAGKQLAKAERYSGIAQLVSCIKQSGTNDSNVTDMCDEMLMLAVATFTKANVSGTKVEELIKLISDKSAKISAYIEAKQLKTAYFLAVKYKRMSDIRRISREAELLNQPSIKALCQKILQSHSHSSTISSD